MDSTEVISTLSHLPVGSVIAWGGVIIGIVVAVFAGIVKLYKLFKEFKKRQDDHENNLELLRRHDDVLDDMNDAIKRIEAKLDTEADVHMRSLKHTITTKCNRAIKDGEILMSELRSVEEMYADYKNIYDGNSWVHTLIDKIRALPIVYDIDDE